jgi:uncharacterized membrane protein YhaH (DUF805 family)
MTESSEKRTVVQASARYGMYIGMLLILIQTIQYLAGLFISVLFFIFSVTLFVVAVMMLIRDYRDKDLNGWMNYGQGVSVGAMSSLTGALIYGSFMLILVMLVDKSYIEQYFIQTREMMEASNFPADQIDKKMDQLQESTSPWEFGYSPILWYGFFGLIISLIASIFFRKNPDNSFDQDTL